MSTDTRPYSCVLFDVDGTLVDSGPVVIDGLLLTLETFGLPIPPRESMGIYVGPPLWESFPQLGVPEERLEEVVAFYREHYKARCLEPPLYPGIAALLRALAEAGVPIATATSKQEPMAKEQMAYLGLAEYFTVLAGATPDPACTKTTVLIDALARLEAAGADISRAVLVGDRHFDLTGARNVGIACIGAGWGYAQPGEFDGADHVVPTAEALKALLLPA